MIERTENQSGSARRLVAIAVLFLHVAAGIVLLTRPPTLAREAEPPPLVVLPLSPSPPPPPHPTGRSGGSPAPRRVARQTPASPAPPVQAHAAAPVPIVPLALPAPATSGQGVAVGGSGSQGEGGSGPGRGSGVGDGDERATPARQTGGDFKSSDFPRSARAAAVLRIGVRFTVETTGRVGDCAVVRPSGYPDLDMVTCTVIAKRYRFDPARDGAGEPVASVIEEDEVWSKERGVD